MWCPSALSWEPHTWQMLKSLSRPAFCAARCSADLFFIVYLSFLLCPARFCKRLHFTFNKIISNNFLHCKQYFSFPYWRFFSLELLYFCKYLHFKCKKNVDLKSCKYTAKNAEDAREIAKQFSDRDIYVIGGALIYELMLPYCNKALITKVMEEADADAFIRDFDSDPDWILSKESEPIDDNGHEIRFCEYIRK